MPIKINEEQLDQIITLLNNAIINNGFLLLSLASIEGHLNEQQLFGVEKDILSKIEEYNSYFSGPYIEELTTLLDNAESIKTNNIELDNEMKSEVSNG